MKKAGCALNTSGLGGWVEGIGRLLEADALQQAQCLADVVGFLIAGLLLAHGVADGIAKLAEAVDGFAESRFDALHLHDNGFERGLGFFFGGRVGGAVGLGLSLHGWWFCRLLSWLRKGGSCGSHNGR